MKTRTDTLLSVSMLLLHFSCAASTTPVAPPPSDPTASANSCEASEPLVSNERAERALDAWRRAVPPGHLGDEQFTPERVTEASRASTPDQKWLGSMTAVHGELRELSTPGCVPIEQHEDRILLLLRALAPFADQPETVARLQDRAAHKAFAETLMSLAGMLELIKGCTSGLDYGDPKLAELCGLLRDLSGALATKANDAVADDYEFEAADDLPQRSLAAMQGCKKTMKTWARASAEQVRADLVEARAAGATHYWIDDSQRGLGIVLGDLYTCESGVPGSAAVP